MRRMTSDAYMGCSTEKTLPRAFVRGASGVARDLVGDRERQAGVFAASGDVAMEGGS
jgi:hypothetical protein